MTAITVQTSNILNIFYEEKYHICTSIPAGVKVKTSMRKIKKFQKIYLSDYSVTTHHNIRLRIIKKKHHSYFCLHINRYWVEKRTVNIYFTISFVTSHTYNYLINQRNYFEFRLKY